MPATESNTDANSRHDALPNDATPNGTASPDNAANDAPINDDADNASSNGDTHPDQSADAADANPRLVPVTESIKYRKRAQAAEQRLTALEQQFHEATAALDEARQTADALERRQHIDALLTAGNTVDLEVARLLTEAAVESMDEPDVEAAVQDLRRSKPYLFRASATHDVSAMPARQRNGHGGALIDHAAEQAASTGHRRDLLRYLRMRRGA